MPIQSKEEAFKVLDTIKWGIPFKAIEYLYEHPKDEEILAKIRYSLEHAYDKDVYYDEEEDFYYNTPLWYTIVAESHLDITLVDSLIEVFNPNYDAWDVLAEQTMYVIAHLSKTFPNEAPVKFLAALEEATKTHRNSKNIFNFIYVTEAFRHLDLEKHGNRLLKLLRNPDNPLNDVIAGIVADINYKAAIPILKDLIDFMKMDYPGYANDSFLQGIMIEYQEALSRLQGKNKEKLPEPYHLSRASWKEHYQDMEYLFKKTK